jgi:glycosyltransferase involved in cell wall biosynthesis
MKIVHVITSIDPVRGGPPQVAMRLAAAQTQLGHDVHVVAYGHDASSEERSRQQFAKIPHLDEINLHLLPRAGRLERLTASRAHRFLVQLLPGSNWLHLHGVWERILHRAANLAQKLDIPYCLRPSGMLNPWSLSQKRTKKRLALAVVVRRVINGSRFIHCLTAEEAAMIKPVGLAPPSLDFPSGIFLEEIEPLPPAGTFLATHPQLGGRRFVLFLSRLHHVKGLDFLAEAWAKCASRIPDVDLVVAGPDDGAQRDFEMRIARAGLERRVHLVGPLYGADKFAALTDAACFCLPSRTEGFSVAIVEALACGVPVVMSEACRFPEAAAAGAARMVPLDAMALADAIGDLLSDPQRAKVMGQAGWDLIRRDYTWPAIAKRIIEAYQRAS